MMTKMMSTFKQNLLCEFEDYSSSTEIEGDMIDNVISEQHEPANVYNVIDSFINADSEPNSGASPFADLVVEFSTASKTGPAVDGNLTSLVDELCKDQLPIAKLEELLEQYPRPENCTSLFAP